MKTYTNIKSSSKKVKYVEFNGGIYSNGRYSRAEGTLTYTYKGNEIVVSGEFYAIPCKNGKDILIQEAFPDSGSFFTMKIKDFEK